MSDFSDFIADCRAENGWTPDVPLLDTQDDWYVFVYGKRRGKSSAYFTHANSEAEFVSIAWTKSDIYSILNIQDGDSELKLATLNGTDRILGEVWKVPTEKLIELDGDERNIMLTERIRVPVCIGARGVVSAWIYLAHRSYLLEGGLKISKYTGCTYFGSQKFLEIH